tara:strand:+ start:337 stop:591 length:255 start_codon:yes stop_codon:yes gene_type:complete
MGGRISKPINKDKYTIDDTEQLNKNLDNIQKPKSRAGGAALLMLQNRNLEAKKLGFDKLVSMRKRGLLDDSTVRITDNKKTTLG